MTDRTQFEQMLEALISEDQQTAKDIFHNIVVAKSREIYEELLAEDFGKEEDKSDDESADESADDSAEGDDFSDKDSTDDMVSDVDADSEEGGEPEGDVEDRVQDLEDALEDLKAEFEQLMAGEQGEEMPADDMGGDDMGGDEFGAEEPAEGDDLFGAEPVEQESMGGDNLTVTHKFAEDDERLIREYIEKVGMNWESSNPGEGSHVGAQAGSVTGSTNTKSIVASKNDMGGTTANIAQGHREVSADVGAKSTVQGNGVMKPNVVPNPNAKGNINVPGGKAGKTGFKKQEPGHGAEKSSQKGDGKHVGAQAGSVTGSTNTRSTLNPRK